MCQVCGHNVEFFAGVPTGRAPVGTISFDTSANYAMYVFNGGWQQVGVNFGGMFQTGGGTQTTDYNAVTFFAGVPTGRAPQGAIAFDTSAIPYTIWVFSAGWQQIGVSAVAAADVMAICGPNVLFSATNPPPAPAACLPQGTIVIPVVAGPHAGYVSNNCVLEPFDVGGGPPPVFNEIFITSNAATFFHVPLDFNIANNKIEIIARGGSGGLTSSLGGGGGGGGGYAWADNVNLTPGTNVTVHFGFADGETVYMMDNSSTIICQASNGRYGNHTAGGAGGVKLVGDGGNPGGKGGSATGSGGGGAGGAGGPLGPGGDGGNSLGNSGGGGGGANNGAAGQVSVGSGSGANGGTGDGGTGAGGLGMTYPPPLNDGGPGLAGGGGGGAGGAPNSIPGAFGLGGTANGDHFYGGANKAFCGGGGGGAGDDSLVYGPYGASTGGSGFNRGYGGGGGGSGGDAAGGAGPAGGCDGEIRITYTT